MRIRECLGPRYFPIFSLFFSLPSGRIGVLSYLPFCRRWRFLSFNLWKSHVCGSMKKSLPILFPPWNFKLRFGFLFRPSCMTLSHVPTRVHKTFPILVPISFHTEIIVCKSFPSFASLIFFLLSGCFSSSVSMIYFVLVTMWKMVV